MLAEITRRVCLDPMYLDNNILDHLLNKIRVSTLNECTKEYGYILSVERIVDIIDNTVSAANSDIVFTVKFEVHNLKPDIGVELSGTVCLIGRHGIFIYVHNEILKVMVPIDSMTGYSFIQNELNNEKSFYKNGEKTIKIGDTLLVRIVGSKYSKKNFLCYGDIIQQE